MTLVMRPEDVAGMSKSSNKRGDEGAMALDNVK